MGGEIAKPTKGKWWIGYGRGHVHHGRCDTTGVVSCGEPHFETFDNEQDFLAALEAAHKSAFPTLPTAGNDLVEGQVYLYGTKLYQVRQSHRRTEGEPDTAPTLFTRVRPAGEHMEWIAGERCMKGLVRTYQGTAYESLRSHVTQVGYEPSKTPDLWVVVKRTRV